MVNFDGICVALITPWRDGEIDVPAVERIVHRVCDSGVVAVCPAGTTGEGPRLTRAQRIDLTRHCADQVPRTVHIVAGTVSASVAETLAEIEDLAAAGAHAVLVTPPTRMPLGAAGIGRYFTELADRTPLPLVLYHIPQLTGVPIPPGVVFDLAPHPTVIGLKDSAGDLQYHLKLADGIAERSSESFALLTGTDTMLLAAMHGGASGAITASANLVPELSVRVHHAVRQGHVADAREAERRLRAIVLACRRGTGPSGWKAAMQIAGHCGGDPVPPGETLSTEEYEALRQDLERLGVLS